MKVQMAMMLLTEKRCGKVKGRMVFDGRKTREWITKEDSASPTATLEGILLTLTIDAHENRDVISHMYLMPSYKPRYQKVFDLNSMNMILALLTVL